MADTKRANVAKKVYINKVGEESRHAGPDTVRVELRFTDGNTLVSTLDQIGKGCKKACGWHGLGHKLSDAYAGAVKSGEIPFEMASAVLERLEADDWVKPGEAGGPRISLLVEAVCAVLVKAGKAVTDEIRANVATLLRDKSARDTAVSDPNVAAEYAAIKAKAAADRATAAAEVAKSAAPSNIAELFA